MNKMNGVGSVDRINGVNRMRYGALVVCLCLMVAGCGSGDELQGKKTDVVANAEAMTESDIGKGLVDETTAPDTGKGLADKNAESSTDKASQGDDLHQSTDQDTDQKPTDDSSTADDTTENGAQGDGVTGEGNAEDLKFSFYDVFKTKYEATRNPMVSVNPYTESNYTYIEFDATGKRLAGEGITPGTGLGGDKLKETIGYEGIIRYEDENYTSRFGVDVSKFQGVIDWNKVKSTGVEFAFIRIGFRGYGESGMLVEDPFGLRNIRNAHDAGLDVGVYFFSQAVSEEESKEEANFVLSLLGEEKLELPIVYDPEHILNEDARTDDVTGEQFTRNVLAFCEVVREAGHKPMVYCNMLWQAFELDMEVLKEIPIWYADYERLPQTPYHFEVWQYSQSGRLSGIDGVVDLNIQMIPVNGE